MRKAVVEDGFRETTRHRILIVDDEESTRLLLARMVSQDLKADVQLAGTSVQALKLAENYVYDAILLDLLMPGMDGFELLARIRAGTPNAATPVIVVSVLSEEKDRMRALSRGASAYHVKPVRRSELVAAVKAQLAARGKPSSTR
jgi:DNA-binding response OmpR family regulator